MAYALLDPDERGPGRPSKCVRHAPLILEWLREDPQQTTAALFARMRRYQELDRTPLEARVGKSGFYALVSRLRTGEAAHPVRRAKGGC